MTPCLPRCFVCFCGGGGGRFVDGFNEVGSIPGDTWTGVCAPIVDVQTASSVIVAFPLYPANTSGMGVIGSLTLVRCCTGAWTTVSARANCVGAIWDADCCSASSELYTGYPLVRAACVALFVFGITKRIGSSPCRLCRLSSWKSRGFWKTLVACSGSTITRPLLPCSSAIAANTLCLSSLGSIWNTLTSFVSSFLIVTSFLVAHASCWSASVNGTPRSLIPDGPAVSTAPSAFGV
jgi:hypothetical protein